MDEFLIFKNHLSNILPNIISENKKTIHLTYENYSEVIKSRPSKISYNGKTCWINNCELKHYQREQININNITKIKYDILNEDEPYNCLSTVYYK